MKQLNLTTDTKFPLMVDIVNQFRQKRGMSNNTAATNTQPIQKPAPEFDKHKTDSRKQEEKDAQLLAEKKVQEEKAKKEQEDRSKKERKDQEDIERAKHGFYYSVIILIHQQQNRTKESFPP